MTIDAKNALAASEYIESGLLVRLCHLMQDPADRKKTLKLVPLLLLRGEVSMLVPDKETVIVEGDRILYCATYDAKVTLLTSINNNKAFNYIMSGKEVPDSIVWRWIKRIT